MTIKDFKKVRNTKDLKEVPLSMDNVFVLLWVVVLSAAMIVMLLGQVLTTILLCVAIVAYINRQFKAADEKK